MSATRTGVSVTLEHISNMVSDACSAEESPNASAVHSQQHSYSRIPLLGLCEDNEVEASGSEMPPSRSQTHRTNSISEAMLRPTWSERAWISAGFTFFCAMCFLAHVSYSESKLLSDIALALGCVCVGASSAGYCFGRNVEKRTRRETAMKRQNLRPADDRKSTAQDKLIQLKAEGVVDSGWLEEYIEDEEDFATASKGLSRLKKSSLTVDFTTVAEEIPRNGTPDGTGECQVEANLEHFRHISDTQERFLGDLNWNCDTCRYGQLDDIRGKPIFGMGLYLMDHHSLVTSIPDWMLKPEVSPPHSELQPHSELRIRVQNFFLELDDRYLGANPYHNGTHACDVMKNIKGFFETELLRFLCTCREWTWFLSVLPAAIHDVGHTGQTNNYHIAIRSKLALLYNDKSPLEQMHVSTAFQIMNEKPETDWFGLFLKECRLRSIDKMIQIQSRLRKVLIAMVLATDNLKHNECVERLDKLITNQDLHEVLNNSSEARLLVLEAVLHGADISHPTYELNLHISWSSRVLEEFWAQGDLEKRVLGAASMPMFDRDKMDVPGAQVGFFKFIALGLWEPLVILLPEMKCRLEQMKRNLVYWNKRKDRGCFALPASNEEHDVVNEEHDATATSRTSKVDRRYKTWSAAKAQNA